jgi:uncharacterized protein (DUF885 family)
MRPLVIVALAVTIAMPQAQTPASPAARALHQQFERDWQYWMTQHPEFATAIGYPGQNARWTDYSASAIEARAAYLRQSLQDLGMLERSGLLPEEGLSYDLYRQMLETAVAGLEFENDAIPIRGVIPHNLLMPMNQLEGIQQDIPRTIAMMPAVTAADYENIAARLEALPPLVDQTIALMQAGLTRGATPPRVTFRDVPGQVVAQIVVDPLKSPLLDAFTRWPATVPAADRERLLTRATAAYTDRVAPAFRRLHEFLVKTYLPGCRETIAAAALPSGAGLYAYNVRWHTTTEQSPAQIHETGLAEVKRIRAAMDRVISDAGFKGGFEAFGEFLRTDRRFYFTAAEDLLRGYRDVAKRADPELARLFGNLPETPYGVIAVPDAIAPSQTTAYYEPGALTAGRPAYMYANTFKLDARPKWEMEALTLHEAVPGHHLQIAIAQEIQGLPEFRKHSSYTAFVEGWALYAERLGDEMGFYQDPYSRFGQLTYEMWRAVRLVVDTGMHAMGWSRQQAIDFFKANAAKTEQDIIVEIDRYIVWPGQALGYKIGELKIRELRARAEKALGGRFDIRGFHDEIVGQGALPLDVLETRINAWIGRRLGRP